MLQWARSLQRSDGNAEYRQRRVVVEHRLARLVQLGVRQARYFGRTKTLFQLLMASTVANLTLVAGKVGLMGGIPATIDYRPSHFSLAAISTTWWSAILAGPEWVIDPGYFGTTTPIALHQRGFSSALLGTHEEAHADHERALGLDAGLMEAYVNRGATYAALGDIEAAHASLEKALSLDTEQEHQFIIHSLRGSLYLSVDDLDNAVESFLASRRGAGRSMYKKSYSYSERG